MVKKLVNFDVNKKIICGIVISILVMALSAINVKAADYSAWISIFDPTYYAAHYSDAAQYAAGDQDRLWKFFITVGIPRLDQASEEFNPVIYAKNYPQLQKAFGGNYMQYYVHYATAGKAAGYNAKTLGQNTAAAKPATPAPISNQPNTSNMKAVDGIAVANLARSAAGTPYVYGGADLKKGVDCSGFTYAVYKSFGINVPHRASLQAATGVAITREQMLPGDLIVFTNYAGQNVSDAVSGHCYIVIGPDAMMDASPYPGPGRVVINKVDDYFFNQEDCQMYIRRVFNNTATSNTAFTPGEVEEWKNAAIAGSDQ